MTAPMTDLKKRSRSTLFYDASSQKQPTRIQLVLEYIKDEIAAGTFKPGSKLPTESEISETLGVSRTPVREAIKILEAIGLLDVRVGAGTFVHPGLQPSLAQVLMLQLYLRQTTSQKLMEARRMIERGCAELAAERRTDEDLVEMRACIAALEGYIERSDASVDEMLEADLEFHRCVFRATKNELAEAIAGFVLDMVTPWIRQSMESGGPARAAYNHRLEYSMIEARNAGAARESVVLAAVDKGMDHWLQTLQTKRTDPSGED